MERGRLNPLPISRVKQYLVSKLLVIVVLTAAILYATCSSYNLASGTGNLCVVLFIFANTYVPAKRLRLLFNFKNVNEEFNIFLGWHCIINVAAFFLCCVHCFLSNWVNIWLKIAVVLMGWLILGGVLMKFRYPATIKKGIYFLHTQQAVFVLLLYALLKGHYFF